MNYTVIIEKGRESGYVAFCPVLRGCVSQGKNKKQALASLKIAMKDYIECLIEDGIPLPTETGKETVKIGISAK